MLFQDLIQTGMYGNQSEVIRAGLRLFIEREQEREARLAALRAYINVAVSQLRAGDVVEVDADGLKKRLRNQGKASA